MTPAELERLAVLSEELGEAQQAIGKILRFGYNSLKPHDEYHPGNKGHLQIELGHVLAAIKILCKTDLNEASIIESRDTKGKYIQSWLRHQDVSTFENWD